MLIRLVVFKFGGNGLTNFFCSRVIRASGCYYCKFLRDHRRPEAYRSFRDTAVSLCFSWLVLSVFKRCK